MIKKLFVVILILAVIFYAGIDYLNRVYLPTKIKSLIIQGLEEQTRKKVSLGSLQFNLFKGLVLKDFAIKDTDKDIISIKEADCTFLVWPFFKRQIVIPGVRIKSALIYVERKSNNTFNLSELFVPQPAQGQKSNAKFNLVISKISIADSRINFQDNAISPVFSKAIEDIDLVVNLSLPAAVKFKIKATIPAKDHPLKILASGQYNFLRKKISAKINLNDLAPVEFNNYYQQFRFSLPAGLVDASFVIALENNLLNIESNAETEELEFLKAPINIKLNSDIQAVIKYNLKDKQLSYSGNADILGSSITGLQFVDSIKNISGKITFNNSSLSSDKLTLTALNFPVEVKLKLTDFNNPLLNIKVLANPDLASLKNTLSDKFKIDFPAQIQGTSKLNLSLKTRLAGAELLELNGVVDIYNASLKFEKNQHAFEAINASFVLGTDHLKWDGLNFKYALASYKSSGILNNFKNPAIKLLLNSDKLSVQSEFTVKDKIVNITQLSGKYFDSDFSLAGKVIFAQSNQPEAGINGELNIDLQDLDKILEKHKEKILKIKPEGKIQAKFTLEGNPNNLKSCLVKASLSSPTISAYGLHSGEAIMEASLTDGLINISPLQMSLYGGALAVAAKVNLNSANFPFLLEASLQNIKLEKLKLDTPIKERDISGNIQVQADLSGFFQDFSKTSGQGQILITEGRLWQLDLFKGMGKLIFVSDFTNIVFHQGSCNFLVADKYISSDNLQLTSNLVNITGVARIGFDSSIDATLKVQMSPDAPMTGSVKDIATVILGQADKFGVIKISGTLKEPKHKFEPAVVDIINTIKDIFWKK